METLHLSNEPTRMQTQHLPAIQLMSWPVLPRLDVDGHCISVNFTGNWANSKI